MNSWRICPVKTERTVIVRWSRLSEWLRSCVDVILSAAGAAADWLILGPAVCLSSEQLRDARSLHPTSHGVYHQCNSVTALRLDRFQSLSVRCMYGARTVTHAARVHLLGRRQAVLIAPASSEPERKSVAQSCPWVHFVWPNPTQPNPLQVKKIGPNPILTVIG